jgi:hypothetical protein
MIGAFMTFMSSTLPTQSTQLLPPAQNAGQSANTPPNSGSVFSIWESTKKALRESFEEGRKLAKEEREMERLGCPQYCRNKLVDPSREETTKCLDNCEMHLLFLRASRRID